MSNREPAGAFLAQHPYKPKAKPITQRFVPKPNGFPYLDLKTIFRSFAPTDCAYVICRSDTAGGVQFFTADDVVDLPTSNEVLEIDEMLNSSKTKGKEELIFLRALADLMTATLRN